jgi:hypothetical protein
MPKYGDVIYNPKAAVVAAITATDPDIVYGTPVFVDYIDRVSFEFEADNDELNSGGQTVEAISIIKKGTGTLMLGSLDLTGSSVPMLGITAQTYGTTPNRYTIAKPKTGGQGLPYFGMIVEYAALNGANCVVAFPKCLLETYPAFDVEQNRFRRGEAAFSFFSPSVIKRELYLLRTNETAAALPATQLAFQSYLEDLWD